MKTYFTSKEKEQLNNAKKLIEANPRKHWTIAEVSEQIGMNETYLKAGYKKYFGTSMFEYLEKERMTHASILLQNGETVEVVAKECGYTNHTGFSLAFKRYFKITPTNFRAQHRGVPKLIYVKGKQPRVIMAKPITFTEKDVEQLNNAKQLIASNIKTHFTMDQIGQKIGLKTYRLRIGFKKYFGQSPFDYLTSMRMNLALTLLKEEISIVSIAEQCGYSTESSFSEVFKRQYKMLPRQFRLQLLNNDALTD